MTGCVSIKKSETPINPQTLAVTSGDISISKNKIANGSLFWITYQINDKATLKSVIFENNEVPFFLDPKSRSTYFSFIGIPYGHAEGKSSILVKLQENEQEKTLTFPLTILKGDYLSETLTVDPKHVEPSPKDLARIKREANEIALIYKNILSEKFWGGLFVFPMKSEFTSVYGTKRIFNGSLQSYHNGADFKANEGTPVYASQAGRVDLSKDLFLSGNTVLINHGWGIFTVYAHLEKLNVKKGQQVRAYELIGLSGKTGRVSGPHLHWGVVVNRVKINPLDLLGVPSL
ncbi:MAG: M23 family metallopeptidase [Bdellovibrio sp.]|nr:M23 family metallopeptidase [Bdellovibrio sp.]